MIGKPEFRLEALDWESAQHFNDKRNHIDVRRWCRQTGLINDEQHYEWYCWQAKDPNTRMYAIWAKEKVDGKITDKPVGVCGLTSIDWVHRRAEFSCYTFSDQRLKGYAKKALTLLFEHGFNDLNLNIIWGETFDGNPALGLFLQLGMVEEGTRREFYFKEGKYLDAHLISIKRDEWNSQES